MKSCLKTFFGIMLVLSVIFLGCENPSSGGGNPAVEDSGNQTEKPSDEIIAEFEKARYEEQISLMQTGKSDEDKMKKVQEIYAGIVEMEEGRKYFEAELKFNVLLGDVNRIISEAVKDLLL